MKTLRISILLSVLISFLTLVPLNAQTAEDQYHSEFNVQEGVQLQVQNKFGSVQVLNWDKNLITIDVKIKVEAKSQATAEAMLKSIKIKIDQRGNIISAVTDIDEPSNFKSNQKFSIDYEIHAPGYSNLGLSNKFGDVFIKEFSGLCNIDVKYGNLKIIGLKRGKEKTFNQVTLSFSEGSISEAGWLKLDLEFSKINISNAEALVAVSKYSGLNVESCNSLATESEYDSYKIASAKNLVTSMKFSNLYLGSISGKLELESSYSGVKIAEVLPSAESIIINNSRGDVKMRVNENCRFFFTGEADKGDIHIEGFEIQQKKTDGTEKYIEAKLGNPLPGHKIECTVSSGSISVYVK